MPLMIDAYKKVPLMFQAQAKGRCQTQFIDKNKSKQDVEIWQEQWTEKSEEKAPDFPKTVNKAQEKLYQFSWRFVTNGGQDENMIRPVMGSYGIPYYPGSSMKGAFRHACQRIAPDRVIIYCGDAENPGCLRFHGGYPTNNDWQSDLIDLVHPQKKWQVKNDDTKQRSSGETAYTMISLYKPEFKFGISSNEELDEDVWGEIWQIWDKAVFNGLGCRVSAGYGQLNKKPDNVLYQAHLEGQGMASNIIGGEPEFRPNMFKAAIRNHALRIFGGLTSENNAEKIVENLFGGTSNGGTVGLLAINWRTIEEDYDYFDKGYDECIYKVKGILSWRLTQEISEEKKKGLIKLIKALIRFAMLLGSFGKSWRRVNHDLFFQPYYQRKKPYIGCHWKWWGKSLDKHNLVTQIDGVSTFIDKVTQVAKDWLKLENVTLESDRAVLGELDREHASWRESWYRGNVQVWGRIASNEADSIAVKWFHEPYNSIIHRQNAQKGSIKETDLTGSMNQISRIWHRMYPLGKKRKNPQPQQSEYGYPPNIKYLELLTIFSDRSNTSEDFLQFLGSEKSEFVRLW